MTTIGTLAHKFMVFMDFPELVYENVERYG